MKGVIIIRMVIIIVVDLDYSTVVSIIYFKCLHNMYAGISDSVEEKLTTFNHLR